MKRTHSCERLSVGGEYIQVILIGWSKSKTKAYYVILIVNEQKIITGGEKNEKVKKKRKKEE